MEEESSVRAFWDLGVGEVEDLPQLSPLSAGVGEERWSYGIWVAKLQAAGFSVLPSSPLIPAAGPLPTAAAFFLQSGDVLSVPLSPFCNSVLFSLLCLCLSVGTHVSPPSTFLPPFFPLPRFCFSHLCVSLPVSPSPFCLGFSGSHSLFLGRGKSECAWVHPLRCGPHLTLTFASGAIFTPG